LQRKLSRYPQFKSLSLVSPSSRGPASGTQTAVSAGGVENFSRFGMIAGMPVEIVRRHGGKKFPARKLKTAALKILQLIEQDQAELSIALIGDAEMRKLNARFRNKDYPTDVLSFPVGDVLSETERLLGDVIISVAC
jgi:hypothetical protein